MRRSRDDEGNLQPAFHTYGTHPAFWDCECDEDYIHIKSETLHCDKCGADEDDMPDAHTKEVLYMLLDQARELDYGLFQLSIKSKRHLKMVAAVEDAYDMGNEKTQADNQEKRNDSKGRC